MVEDYDEEGFLPLDTIQACFHTLDIDVSPELFEYIIYSVYSRSESLKKLKYQVLIDMADGKVA